MLMRNATRRTAAVLMIAFVAMLLVAVGGSRHVQTRMITGAGQASSDQQPVRHAALVAPTHSDELQVHLDLSSTPPATQPLLPTTVVVPAPVDAVTFTDTAEVTPIGRAPPRR